MREEITEPKHWRASPQCGSPRRDAWISGRRVFQARVDLAAEAVDAALETDAEGDATLDNQVAEPVQSPLGSAQILANLASQLDQQHAQIQQLLKQVQQ
jgi:hypothetical protein